MTEGPEPGAPFDPADAQTEEAIEAGRKLFAQECRFFWAAARIGGLPPVERPEVAFAGRSNVGKSSLLNALTGRNSLARTSQTPGRTREINFFDLGGRLTLVDLPGYGYAKASKTAIAGWTDLMIAYLEGRPSLTRLCLLIDSRHGVKPPDHQLMELADRAAVAFQVVLTKADKTPASALEKIETQVLSDCRRYTALYPALVSTSADTGLGIPLLRSYLAGLAAPAT